MLPIYKFVLCSSSRTSLLRAPVALGLRSGSTTPLVLQGLLSKRYVSTLDHTHTDKPLRIDRDLPDPRTDRTKFIAGFFLFSGLMITSLAVIFNYEKTENPIISTTLYQLRRSEKTKNLLGENIEFDGLIPWIYGKLNPVAGKINIRFYIKGDKDKSGEIKLIADRANRNQEFLIHEWSLTVDGKQVDLLSENNYSSFL